MGLLLSAGHAAGSAVGAGGDRVLLDDASPAPPPFPSPSNGNLEEFWGNLSDGEQKLRRVCHLGNNRGSQQCADKLLVNK